MCVNLFILLRRHFIHWKADSGVFNWNSTGIGVTVLLISVFTLQFHSIYLNVLLFIHFFIYIFINPSSDVTGGFVLKYWEICFPLNYRFVKEKKTKLAETGIIFSLSSLWFGRNLKMLLLQIFVAVHKPLLASGPIFGPH